MQSPHKSINRRVEMNENMKNVMKQLNNGNISEIAGENVLMGVFGVDDGSKTIAIITIDTDSGEMVIHHVEQVDVLDFWAKHNEEVWSKLMEGLNV